MTTKHKYPTHRYPIQFKQQVVKRYEEQERGKRIVPEIFFSDGDTLYAPSLPSIEKWRKQMQDGTLDNTKTFSPWNKKLLEAEKLLVCGKVISLRKQFKIVDASVIRQFVLKEFRVTVSKTWVSRVMADHHLSSRLTSDKKPGYFKGSNVKSSFLFIQEARALIKANKIEDKHVVCLDVAKFSRKTHNIRTYVPIGGYVKF